MLSLAANAPMAALDDLCESIFRQFPKYSGRLDGCCSGLLNSSNWPKAADHRKMTNDFTKI